MGKRSEEDTFFSINYHFLVFFPPFFLKNPEEENFGNLKGKQISFYIGREVLVQMVLVFIFNNCIYAAFYW